MISRKNNTPTPVSRSGIVVAIGAFALGTLLLFASAVEADAIPAFARKYRVSCQLCHNPIPRLTEFGETFAGNGFRFSAAEPARDTIDTGDRLLELARDLPLAIRFDAFAQGFTNGESGTDLETPYNLKVLSGGPISGKLSYYFYFFLFERGEVGGVEDAFVYVNDIGGLPIDVAVGQFQVSDPMFKRELRLEFEDYAIYRARIGDQPADLTYDRGISAVAELGEFTLTGTLLNGNGKGEARENRRFDDDLIKNLFAHVSRPITSNLRLGVMGYYGRQAEEGDGDVDNDLWMAGADFTLNIGQLEVNGQYIHREDDAPTFTADEPEVKTDGGFVEAIYMFADGRWYATALYNVIYSDEPQLDVGLGGPPDIKRWQTISAGGGYVLRRNFRLMGEFGWDTEQEATRWTLGLVTAF
ncbi:MAG: hypothetical protein JSV41_13480 [Gemmatimonadota bacterium]|nr:MAG: hypothetical protein JSV41_13480 [Gemmatimonadota bacterium]